MTQSLPSASPARQPLPVITGIVQIATTDPDFRHQAFSLERLAEGTHVRLHVDDAPSLPAASCLLPIAEAIADRSLVVEIIGCPFAVTEWVRAVQRLVAQRLTTTPS